MKLEKGDYVALNGRVIKDFSTQISDDQIESIKADKVIADYSFNLKGSSKYLRFKIPEERWNEETRNIATRLEYTLVPGLHVITGPGGGGKTTFGRDIVQSLLNAGGLTSNNAKRKLTVNIQYASEPHTGKAFTLPRLFDEIVETGNQGESLSVLIYDSISSIQDMPGLGNAGQGGIPKSLMDLFSMISDFAAKNETIVIAPFNTGADPRVSNTAFELAAGSCASALQIVDKKIAGIDQRFGRLSDMTISENSPIKALFEKQIIEPIRIPFNVDVSSVPQFKEQWECQLNHFPDQLTQLTEKLEEVNSTVPSVDMEQFSTPFYRRSETHHNLDILSDLGGQDDSSSTNNSVK